MVKLLDELGVASIDVIGGSFGARVAMVLAPRLAALRSVSFVDAGPEVDVDAARRASATRSSNRSVRAFRDEEDIVEFWAREHPTWDRAALRVRAQTSDKRTGTPFCDIEPWVPSVGFRPLELFLVISTQAYRIQDLNSYSCVSTEICYFDR